MIAARRLLPLLLALALGLLALPALADGAASWRLEAAEAPPPPAGVAPAPYPVPVGEVGQISFWAPNRGLLITAGAGPVPAGLYAYDGVSWHQLSTVCGGGQGRIAWAGPDEFWTISDQRPGQQLPPRGETQLDAISLCHFSAGQVVASYAMPLEEPGSYLKMDAAACTGPADCWFGGETTPTGQGAFHLHWNGSSLGVVYGTEDHAVTSMVPFQGSIYEGVEGSAAFGSPRQPVLHQIEAGEGPGAISPLAIFEEAAKPRALPAKPEGDSDLGEFELASDGSAAGAGATQLWAAADGSGGLGPGVVLHGVATDPEFPRQLTWTQLTLPGQAIAEGSTPAAEPGGEDLWVPLRGGQDARLDLLGPSGEPAEEVSLPAPGEPAVPHGSAGALACPAPGDCWLATHASGNSPVDSVSGWLYHLSAGTVYPPDTDPAFHVLIAYRPPDDAVQQIYPDLPPEDDSLADQKREEGESQPLARRRRPRPPLVAGIKTRVIGRHTLIASFHLSAAARVQLLGSAKGKVVARSRRATLARGPHHLQMRLDPAHWPTKLQVKAKRLAGRASRGAARGALLGGSTGRR